MFRARRRPRIAPDPAVVERLLRIMNAVPVNFDRPRQCEIVVDLPGYIVAPVPARPRTIVNHPLELPRHVVLAMEAMDNGDHAMALIWLRDKNNSQAAEDGINHSL